MKNELDPRAAREQMEMAKTQSERTFSREQKLPRRYRLYDKIKENVSLRTVDAVIVITSILIVAALVVGILTATPPQ